MKKLMSLLLSVAMISATVASAASYTTQTALLDKVFGVGVVSTERNITAAAISVFEKNVESDIYVKESDSNDFTKTSVTVEKSSSADFPEFDFKAVFQMSEVWSFFTECVGRGEAALRNSGVADAETEIAGVPVSGVFTIEITCPDELKIPESVRTASELDGFNDVVKEIFEERDSDPRTWADNKLTIKAYVKEGVTCEELKDFVDDYGTENFELTATNVASTEYGTFKVKGAVEGEIYIGGDYSVGEASDPISRVKYNAVKTGTSSNDNLYATVKIEKKTVSDTDGSGSVGGIYIPLTPAEQIKVQFDIDGNKEIIAPLTGETSVTVNYDDIRPAAINGMEFDGWYLDPEFKYKLAGTQSVGVNLVVYGRYIITSAPSVFDDAHKAYIKGYLDGTVRPEGHITREEITTALYRLLKDDASASITTQTNNFVDVSADRWSNTSISSMSNGGYIKGYDDGTFRPANDITRAEFAVLLLRFFDDTSAIQTVNKFSDVAGHWAEQSIIVADAIGLFNGYEDGTFRPDAFITRAEAMAVINRITLRRSTVDSFVGNYITWPDVDTTDWYYVDVIEATNTHDYERIDTLMNEKWTDVSYTELIVG